MQMRTTSHPSSTLADDAFALRTTSTADAVTLLGRVCIGLIFLMSGWGKLTALSGFITGLASQGVPMPAVLGTIGAIVEFGGGLAIVLGLRVRWAAVALIAFTIVATLIAHRFWELADAARRAQQTQFLKNLAIIGGFLFLAVLGAGRYSIDGLIGRRGPRP